MKKTRVAERWSDDPTNDDWKRNADGSFMRDANGKKIPVSFADDLEKLKKKLRTVSSDVKAKIEEFLFGAGDKGLAVANECVFDTETKKVTLTLEQLKKLL